MTGQAGHLPFRKRLACDGFGITKQLNDRHGQKRVTQVGDSSRLLLCDVHGAYHAGENRFRFTLRHAAA